MASGGSGIIWWGRYNDQKVAIKEIYSVMISRYVHVVFVPLQNWPQ